jgi:hypothetical protein
MTQEKLELREIRFNYTYLNGQIYYDFYCVDDDDKEDHFGICKKITLDYDGSKTTARVEFDTGYVVEVYDVKLSIFKP